MDDFLLGLLSKKCQKCNKFKYLCDFAFKAEAIDKRMYRCNNCRSEDAVKWGKKNPEKMRLKRERYLTKHPGNAQTFCKDWKVRNPHKVLASNSIRRAEKLQRTPAWLTTSDLTEMAWAYQLCSERTHLTGTDHHVDHIVPLKGKYMSGLHVPANLRIVTANLNLSRPKNIKPFVGYDPAE